MIHWTEDGRGAACGKAAHDDTAELSPSMSAPTCGSCRALVQLAIERVITAQPAPRSLQDSC